MIDDYFLIRYDYRRRFLCFHCKKSVEQPNISQLATKNGDEDLLLMAFSKYINPSEREYLNTAYFSAVYTCPTCQRPMVEIPLDYKIPTRKSSLKWNRILSFFRAKGYVRKQIPTRKKDFLDLLQFELENTQYRLNHLQYFTYKNEDFHKAEKRLLKEIENISTEINALKR